MGAWIEIYSPFANAIVFVSLLSWERGLKFKSMEGVTDDELVAPLVGAWIEMFDNERFEAIREVAPLVGAWIEITIS